MVAPIRVELLDEINNNEQNCLENNVKKESDEPVYYFLKKQMLKM
jgi:hypothetical protein